jgi:DNA ligase (NAD+)
MDAKINRIHFLVDELERYSRAYYIDCEPLVTDYEFDMLLKELEKLECETNYVLPYSPTQRVGSDKSNSFCEVKRDVMMGSIENCYDKEELKDWLNKMSDCGTILIEPKYDGTSCSIIYENGILSLASTRGNGYVGDDITENVKTIKNVPLRLSVGSYLADDYRYEGIYVPKRIEIRGEILLPKSELKRINVEREKEGLLVFANERNAAAGSIKQKDPRVTATRNLVFKPYGVLCDDEHFSSKYLKNQHNCLDVAAIFGFDGGWYVRCVDAYTVLSMLSDFEENFLKTQDFCMDGAVVKVDNILEQKNIGWGQKTPKWAKAFKFKQEQISTTPLKV